MTASKEDVLEKERMRAGRRDLVEDGVRLKHR